MINQVYFDKIKKFYLDDAEKAWKWFKTPNPGLGGISPLDMIKSGRGSKLEKVIDTMLGGIWP